MSSLTGKFYDVFRSFGRNVEKLPNSVSFGISFVFNLISLKMLLTKAILFISFKAVCEDDAFMTVLNTTSVKTGPNENPDDARNTPLGQKRWEPEINTNDFIIIELDKASNIDAISLKDRNSDKPQTFRVLIYYENSGNGLPDDKVCLSVR